MREEGKGRGRPPFSQIPGSAPDIWQLGIELDDVPELAVDRTLWRGMTRGHPLVDDDYEAESISDSTYCD